MVHSGQQGQQRYHHLQRGPSEPRTRRSSSPSGRAPERSCRLWPPGAAVL